MCGLGGIAALGSAPLPQQTLPILHRMIETLQHRGPDHVSIRMDDAVGWAFTRLSLVGLANGSQPLATQDDQVVLMANGEIYNHVECAATLPDYVARTESDCEVLLGLYERHGLNFLDDVRGIFAVVLHDKRNNQLVLATDPFANKPLFFARSGNCMVFGSEIKALFDDPGVTRELDWLGALADQSLSSFPAMSHAPVNTWFRGVEKVAAGTIVTIDLANGAQMTHQYWTPALPLDEADAPSAAAYVEHYRELLWSSVEDSLMSDVELGLFLSGGVDSVAIAAIAARLGQPLHTFTVATEATVINGDVTSARKATELLGLENTVATLGVDTIPRPEDWKSLLWLMETPLAGPEQYYKFTLHRAAKRHRPQIRATLLGAGADEFNGGYTALMAMGGGWQQFMDNITRLAVARVARPELAPWLFQQAGSLLAVPSLTGGAKLDAYRDYVTWKWRDIEQYNCWHEDRSAAGNGIEARVPFLDRRLVDLAASVPVSMREKMLWDKGMARAAVADVLPHEFAYREKKPFFDGRTARFAHEFVTNTLRQDKKALVEEALSGPAIGEYVDADALRDAVESMGSGQQIVHPEIVLRLVNLGLLDIATRSDQPPFRTEHVTMLASSMPSDEEAISLALGGVAVAPSSVLALAPGSRLARDEISGEGLLICGNEIAFTLEDSLVPEWAGFLHEIDGRRTAQQIAIDVKTTFETVSEYIHTCLESGFLVVGRPPGVQEDQL